MHTNIIVGMADFKERIIYHEERLSRNEEKLDEINERLNAFESEKEKIIPKVSKKNQGSGGWNDNWNWR